MSLTSKFFKPVYLGFLAGIFTCIYFFLFYWIDKKQFFNPNIYWGSFSILFLAFGLFLYFERQNAISFPFISGLRGLFFIFFLNSAFYNFFYQGWAIIQIVRSSNFGHQPDLCDTMSFFTQMMFK